MTAERIREIVEAAFALAAEADLMLVLGSSLVVQPAASVPLASTAALRR